MKSLVYVSNTDKSLPSASENKALPLPSLIATMSESRSPLTSIPALTPWLYIASASILAADLILALVLLSFLYRLGLPLSVIPNILNTSLSSMSVFLCHGVRLSTLVPLLNIASRITLGIPIALSGLVSSFPSLPLTILTV